MGDYNGPPDVVELIRGLQAQLARLSRTARPAPQYTTASRPAASDVTGLIIFNTTTGKHEGSDGASWNALY